MQKWRSPDIPANEDWAVVNQVVVPKVHTCQVVGKHKLDPPVAPLKPIPAFGEPFSRVIVNCVGPLPRTRTGNVYTLTFMCASTRFPEAIPLRNIKAVTISRALKKKRRIEKKRKRGRKRLEKRENK